MPGKPNPERDERVKIPLDPETVLRALLAVDPESEPAEQDRDGEPPAERDAGERDQQPRRSPS